MPNGGDLPPPCVIAAEDEAVLSLASLCLWNYFLERFDLSLINRALPASYVSTIRTRSTSTMVT